MDNQLKVAIVQISPIFLDKKQTWEKLKSFIALAADEGAELITWGEALISGYPVWIGNTDGARFDNKDQKRAYATYIEQALKLDGDIFKDMCKTSKDMNVTLIGGVVEREGTSCYATALTIQDGKLINKHRKLKPTFEERMIWSDGDGKGLVPQKIKTAIVGVLNCWENWLPLARTALHHQNETVHVGIWPGSLGLTQEITKFMALEGRSYQIAACGIVKNSDFDHLSLDDFPQKEIMKSGKEFYHDGGSLIMDPKGKIIAGPLIKEEGILHATLNLRMVLEERHNLDISGHYSRPDVFTFEVNQ